MSKFTSEMVDDYAEKVLIGLTKEENQMVLDEFDIIDKTISIINEIPNLEKVEPMTHCLDDFIYELREDVAGESTSIDDALSNCDQATEREVEVPKVVK